MVVSAGVVAWWVFLCAAATLNIVAWSLAANAVARRQTAMPSDASRVARFTGAVRRVCVCLCLPDRCCPCTTSATGPVRYLSLQCLVGSLRGDYRRVVSFAAAVAVMLNATAESTRKCVARHRVAADHAADHHREICSWTAVLTTSTSAISSKLTLGYLRALGVIAHCEPHSRCAARPRPMVALVFQQYVALPAAYRGPTYARVWARRVMHSRRCNTLFDPGGTAGGGTRGMRLAMQ